MTGKPVLAASASENVLFPDPASPVTMMRRPSASGPSLIDVSVPQVPLGHAGLSAGDGRSAVDEVRVERATVG